MMANIYEVCPLRTAPRKGYSDFVQHIGPVISGQLRGSNADAQALRNSLKSFQTTNLSAGQTLCRRNSYVQISCVRLTYEHRNPLISFNSGESPGLGKSLILHISVRGTELPSSPILSTFTAGGSWLNPLILPQTCNAVSRKSKLGDSPSLEAPTKATNGCTPGMQKEKGSAANVALCMNSFMNHEENQHSPVLDGSRNPDLAYGDCRSATLLYKQNQQLAVPQDNQNSSRVVADCLQPSFSQSQIHVEINGEGYENFVGQPFGDSLDFLRCRSSLCAKETMVFSSSPTLIPISSMRERASSALLRSDKTLLSPLSFNWRRITSPCMAVVIKLAVDSPSCFTASTPSRMSWGTRAVTICDFAFLVPVAIDQPSCFWCISVYRKKKFTKGLTCISCDNKLNITLLVSGYQNGNAPQCSNTGRASNQTVTKDNDMACSHDTQTRPKFVYLFLGTPNEFPDSTPTVLRAEADTEVDARAKFPRWTLTFAAQIRTEAPCRLQLFSTDEGFMWVYEQRQSVKESSHA